MPAEDVAEILKLIDVHVTPRGAAVLCNAIGAALKHAEAKAEAREKEECAKIADKFAEPVIAAAIRARAKPPEDTTHA